MGIIRSPVLVLAFGDVSLWRNGACFWRCRRDVIAKLGHSSWQLLRAVIGLLCAESTNGEEWANIAKVYDMVAAAHSDRTVC